MTTPEWKLLQNLVSSPNATKEPASNGWQFISFWGAQMGINFKAPSLETAEKLLSKYGTIFTQNNGETYQLGFNYEVKAGHLSSPQRIRNMIRKEAAE